MFIPALITFPLLIQSISTDYWGYWWAYHGASGPEFWSLNPDWRVCNEGRRQSPVNFNPSRLLFDSHLQFVHVDKHRISGTLNNTGHAVAFTADLSSAPPVLISGGPLSYQYTFQRFHLHFGLVDRQRSGAENVTGSEHRVDGQQFPAEIQLLGFNSHLYGSFEEAVQQPHGIVGIAVLIQIYQSGEPNQELRIITDAVKRTTHKGDSTPLAGISLRLLLPNTEQFLTYEGSLTSPGCEETVTWILFNKPIYMSRQQLHMLQRLRSGPRSQVDASTLGNNFRPIQLLHNRVVRTNIDFHPKIKLLRGPGNSPDLNTTENCWNWMNSEAPRANNLDEIMQNGDKTIAAEKGCRAMKREMGYKASKWLGV